MRVSDKPASPSKQITSDVLSCRLGNHHCAGCPLRSYYPNALGRKIACSVHEEARDDARSLRDTPGYH